MLLLNSLPGSIVVILLAVFLPLDIQVSGQYSRAGAGNSNTATRGTGRDADITQYILQRLLGDSAKSLPSSGRTSKASVEERIFSDARRRHRPEGPSVIYPEYDSRPSFQAEDIKRYLDEAKAHLDVIDFRRPRSGYDKEYVRRTRNNPATAEEELHYSDGPVIYRDSRENRENRENSRENSRESYDRITERSGNVAGSRGSSGSASEQVPIKLAYPERIQRSTGTRSGGCTNCIPTGGASPNRWTMPLTNLGKKQYYLGVFFKANWYKAQQYCRFHAMDLASINSAEEQRDLQEHIQAYGMGHEHFWTSGTDQGEEGKFFWLANGRPVTYSNWNAGEPNNFEYEDGEQEHCLEMWDRDGKGLGWNDTPCSFETYFICEITE